jgi:Ca2+-binding EF-hand superfamily protein
LFDRNGDGAIKTSELGTILRALGKCPTEAELKTILASVNSEKLDFEQFKRVIAGMKKDNSTAAQEIRDAIALFDPEGKGRISTEQVKLILTTMEDKLELKDIEPILAQADENGILSIDKLIHALLS